MKNRKLKLYLWRDVLCGNMCLMTDLFEPPEVIDGPFSFALGALGDYTSGVAFALAESPEQAREMIVKGSHCGGTYWE